jgi:hypothetical protein
MPLTRTINAELAPVPQAASTEAEIGAAPFTGAVQFVTWTPDATTAGSPAPNSRTLQVIDHGPTGLGNTVIASLTLTAASYPKGVPVPIPLAATGTTTPNNPTTGGAPVAAGDVLAFLSTSVGTGIADPGGELAVVADRSY